MNVSAIVTHPLFRGAFSGFLAAAYVDFQAFKSWKSLDDATRFDWTTALFRWAQGAAIGAITAPVP